MSDWDSIGGDTGQAPVLLAATFANTPTSTASDVDVVLDATPDVVFERVPWAPRIGAGGALVLPHKGGRCLVAFDDQGNPWITMWEA